MPREPVLKHRIQRQFYPSSARIQFEKERLLTPPRSSARTEFPVETLLPKRSSDDPPAGIVLGQPPRPLVQRPKGEVGRPGRGGYTLKTILGWDEEEYEKLVACVSELATEHLVVDKTISKQSLASLQIVFRMAEKRLPRLTQYEDCWPARDVLKTKLGNTAYASKQKEGRNSAAAQAVPAAF